MPHPSPRHKLLFSWSSCGGLPNSTPCTSHKNGGSVLRDTNGRCSPSKPTDPRRVTQAWARCAQACINIIFNTRTNPHSVPLGYWTFLLFVVESQVVQIVRFVASHRVHAMKPTEERSWKFLSKKNQGCKKDALDPDPQPPQ